MDRILNLTQHPATQDQIAAGVVEPEAKREIQQSLTFNHPPTEKELWERAKQVAQFAAQEVARRQAQTAERINAAMIGGMGTFMPALAEALRQVGIEPVYAFSQREVKVIENPDGTVTKQSIFRHAGFVPAPKVKVGSHDATLDSRTPAVNLTSFNLTETQKAGLAFRDLSAEDRARIGELNNFTDLPTPDEIERRAAEIASIASKYLENGGAALIAGAPYLSSKVAEELSKRGITPVESFSVRRTVERQQADGSVTKEAVFEHVGYVANPSGGAKAFEHTRQREELQPVLTR